MKAVSSVGPGLVGTREGLLPRSTSRRPRATASIVGGTRHVAVTALSSRSSLETGVVARNPCVLVESGCPPTVPASCRAGPHGFTCTTADARADSNEATIGWSFTALAASWSRRLKWPLTAPPTWSGFHDGDQDPRGLAAGAAW